MSRYILQSLKLKTKVSGSKELSDSGKSWAKAQFDTQYQVIDQVTGLPPKNLALKKKGKNLIIQNGDEQIGTIRDFYVDTHAEAPARYRLDDRCSLEQSLVAEGDKAGSPVRDLVGGVGKQTTPSGSDGYVWHQDTSLCIADAPRSPTSHSTESSAAQADMLDKPAGAFPEAAANTGEGLSNTQLLGMGAGALLLGGGAAALGGGAAGGAAVAAAAVAVAAGTPDLAIVGVVTGGPMYAGIVLEARDDQGNLLASCTIQSDGSYSMTVSRSGGYRGAIMVTAVDTNADAANYIDEVTGVHKSIGVNLRGLGAADAANTSAFVIGSNGSAQLTINISVLSELAVRQLLGGAAWPVNLSMADIMTANENVANAFGIGSNIDITTVLPTATNATGFSALDGISYAERVGLVLAKLSGLDALNGGNVAVSLEQLTATLSGNALSSAGLALVDQGRAQALLALRTNAMTFSAGSGDSDTNTILNRQLLGEAVITGQSIDNNGKLVVQGTALPGSIVVITLPDGTQQSAVADGNGVFTLTSVNVQPTLTQPLEVHSQDALAKPVVYDPPAAPVITANNGHVVSGSGTPASTITVKDGNTVVGSAVVSALGDWSLLVPSNITVAHTALLTATAIDAYGNVSGPGQKTVDVNGIASIISAASDGYINAAEKTSGSVAGVGIDIYLPFGAAVGDVVVTTITRPDATTFALSSTTLDAADIANGKITQTIAAANLQSDGYYRASCVITGTTGGTATAPDQQFVLDTIAPVAPILNDSNGLSINGTAEPGSTITVMAGSTVVGTVGPIGADGNWTLIPATPLSNGTSITATATDAAGNTGTPSASVSVSTAALIITGAVDNVGGCQGLLGDGAQTDDTAPLVTGTLGTALTTDQRLVVYRDGIAVGNATVNGTAWSFADSGLSFANHEYVVKVEDASQTVIAASRPFNLSVIDATASIAAPIVTIPEASSVSDTIITATEKVSLGGVPVKTLLNGLGLVLGDQVSTVVTLPGGAGTVRLISTITQADLNQGFVSQLITQSVLATDGVYQTSTTVSVSASGATSAAATKSFTLNTAGPSAPLADVDAASDSGASQTDDLTNDTTPLITGSGNNGDVITLMDANGVVLGTATVAGGVWSIPINSALSEGIHHLQITATNALGNTSAATVLPVTIDTTSPTPTIDLVSSSDSGSRDLDNITNNTAPVVSGTGDPSSTITIYEGSTQVGTAIVDGSGHWTATLSLTNEGTQTLTATATDAAGNSSFASTALSVEIDTTAPSSAPTSLALDSASDSGVQGDNLTNNATPTINGTAEAGATVTIKNGAGNVVATAVADTNGNWTATTSALPSRQNVLSVTATDAAGNVSANGTITVSVDTTAPNTSATLTSGSDTVGALSGNTVGSNSDGITNDTTPTFTGTGEFGNVITLVLANGTYTTTVASDGSWIIDTAAATPGALTSGSTNTFVFFSTGTSSLDLALPNNGVNVDNKKAFNVSITATDDAGNTGSVTLPIIIDTIVTDPTINISNGISPVSGTGEAGASVVLYESTVLSSSVSVSGGAFSYTMTAAQYNALAVSGTSNATAILTSNVPRDVTFGAITQNGSGANATYTVTGTVSSSATSIRIYSSVQLGNPVTVDGNGSWSVTFGSQLNNGTILTANSVDLAGNIDPPGLEIVQTNDSIPLINSTNGNVITGTGKPGDHIVVTYTVNGSAISLGPVTVQNDGTWSVTPAANQIPENNTVVTATDTDSTGHSSAAVDRLAPNTPTSVALDPLSDSGIPGDNTTNDTTPTLTGSAEAGATITIQKNGLTVATAVADSTGHWSATTSALPSGSNALSIVATDKAGNTSVTPASITIEMDTTAPDAPTNLDMVSASDTGVSDSDDITSNTRPTITGNGTNGDTITLKDANGNVIGTTRVVNGSWSITLSSPLADGLQMLEATATDAAGNTGAAAILPIVIDSSAPAIVLTSVVDDVAGGVVGTISNANVTNDAKPTLTFSAQSGSTVKVYDGATLLGTATESVGSPGAFTFTPGTDLAVGLHSLTAKATDAAGNISTATSAFALTVDTIAPMVPSITMPEAASGVNADESASGGGTPVVVTLPANARAGDVVTTVITKPNGQGTMTLSMTLAAADLPPAQGGSAVGNGPFTVTQLIDTAELTAANVEGTWSTSTTITDVAGNVSNPVSGTFVLDTIAPTLTLVSVGDDVVVVTGNLTSGDTTNDNKPTLTLTAPTGSVVKIYDGAALVGTATESATPGTFVFTPSVALTEGVHAFTATAADAAGNVCTPTAAFNLTVDSSVPPSAVTVSLTESSSGVNAAEAAGGGGTPLVVTLPSDAAVGYTLTMTVTKPDNTTVTYTKVLTQAEITAQAFTQVIPTAVLNQEGSWATSTTLTDLVNRVSTATTAGFTLDTVAPIAPTISSINDNVGLIQGPVAASGETNDTTPTLIGTAEANSLVAIYDGATLLATVTADSSGNWTYTPTLSTQDLHSFTAKGTDAAGNTGLASSAYVITLDSIGPSASGVLVVTENNSNASVNAAEMLDGGGVPVTVPLVTTGSTPVQAGDTVKLEVSLPGGGSSTISYVLTASDISAGSVSLIVPTATITADGTYGLIATTIDAAGNGSSATTGSFFVDKTPPSAATGALDSASSSGTTGDNKTNDSTPILSGTVEAGSTVSVMVNGVTYSATVSGTNWNLQLPTALVDGTYTPVITATDPAGNSTVSNGTTFIVDTMAPNAPMIATVNDNVAGGVVGNLANGSATNDTTPTLAGTAEAGSTVDIYDGVTKIATVTADGSGNWAYTPGSAISTGSHSFTVKSTDAAGNSSATSSAFLINVTAAPAAPTFVLAADTGSDNSDGVTNNGAVNVSGLASGASWQYSLDGGTTWLTGSGSAFMLPAGAYNTGAIQVRQTDVAGNTSPTTSSNAAITVDSTVPGAPVITSLVDDVGTITGNIAAGNATNDTLPAISGTAEANSTVALYDGATLLRTTTADSSGNWSYTPSAALLSGAHNFTATATDLAGNISTPSAAHTINIDTTAPTVTATGPEDGGFGAPAANLTITFSENVLKGSGTIRLVNDTDSTYVDIPVSDTGITISGNTVTINPTADLLMAKSYHVEIAAGAFTDTAGNAYAGINDSTTWNFVVPDPAISLNAVATDNIVNATENASSIALSGTLSSASSAVVAGFVAGNITVTLTPQGGGTTVMVTASSYDTTTGAWSGSVAANTLVNGKTYTASVHATATISGSSYSVDTTGQVIVDTTVAAPTLALAADTGSSSSDGITNNGVVNVSGLEAGASWQYSLDNGSSWLTGSGSSLTLPASVYGSGTIKVKQTDAAGNTSTTTSSAAAMTVDVTAPNAPAGGIKHDASNDTGSSATDNITKNKLPVIAGTAEANATVAVTINGTTYTTTADSSGNWSVTVSSNLPDGSYTPSIKATDKAGNSTTANGTAFTVDTAVAANGTGGLASTSDSGVKGDNRTNDTTPDLSGTAEAGATVKVVVNGVTYTTTADANGQWSLTVTGALSNGVTYTPTIQVIDAAGNATAAVNGTPFTIDTVAPSNGTAGLASMSDTGTTGDNKTNDNTPVLSGTAEAGAKVELTVNGKTYVTTAGSTGAWSVDLQTSIAVGDSVPAAVLANGSYTPTIKVTDAAGNATSTVNGTAFTVDTAPPTVSLNTATIMNTANAVVQSTEAGIVYLVKSTVTVNSLADITGAPDSVWNSVAVSANANTNLAATGLVDGTYKAYAVDAAGNLSLVSTNSVIVDTTPPTVTGVAITSATDVLNNRLNTGDVVYVTVTTSEPVTATGGPMVLLNIGGSLTAGSTTPSGGTSVWASLVSGNGTNQLVYSYTILANQADADGISIYQSANNWLYGNYNDVAGNALNKANAYAAVADNANYLVDTTVATPILAMAADTGTNTADRITSNPTINVTGIETGASWQYTTNGGSTWTNGTGSSFNLAAGSYTANQIQVKQTDLAGNAATGMYAYAMTVDMSSSTINSVVMTSATGVVNNTLNRGDTLTLTVNFSEAITVTTTDGVPKLALNIGGRIVYADYTSGTGTTALVFKYTVGNDFTDINGISIDANSLSANGGTLTDTSGNSATLTHAAVADNASYQVDTTSPTVVITRNGSGVVNSSGETLTFTLSEASTDFVVGDITVYGGTLSNFSGSGTSYTALFTPTANSSTTAEIYVGANKFNDAAGNINRDTYQNTGVGIYESNNAILLPVNTANVYTTVSFSSMTKDTSTVATANTNVDWTTADASAGRLLSGTLNAVLTAGQTVQVFSNGNLIGTATVAANGQSWEITDPNGYNANWTYTAKVVGATGVSGTMATRAVTLDAVTDAAPVITAVTDSATTSLANNATTVNAIASVSGTGVANSIVYLYDNNGTNLVSKTTVAANGTWSITGLATNLAVSNVANGNNSNTFVAVQMDAVGNQSVSSNLWTVTSSATNLISNGTFTTDAAGWTRTGTGTVTTYATAPLGVLAFNAGDTAPGGTASQSISTVSGQTYALSLVAYVNGAAYTHTILVEALDASNNVIGTMTRVISGGTPIPITLDFVAADTATTIRITNTATSNTGGSDLFVDNVSVLVKASTTHTLVAGAQIQAATASDDASLAYVAGIVSAGSGNDIIIANASTIQTALANSGYINGGAGVDRLKLASGTMLDLTALTTNQTVKAIQEVEIIELQGGSKLALSANDVLCLGGSSATTMAAYAFASTSGGAASTSSTGKVQMVVDGLTTDKLDLKVLATDGVSTNALLGNTGLAGEWQYMGSTTVNSLTYKVYNHTTTAAQLLVAGDVEVNTHALAFSSMTKDTSTATAYADWMTGDGSAGRLVSGTLQSPLAAGTSIKVYSIVSGIATLIGDAVVNAAGTAWEITDTNSYSTNWSYRADIMSGGAVTDRLTQTVVLDATEPVPVITAVSNGSNITSGSGDQVGGSTSTAMVTSISGTGVAGDTVYVYDNRSSNMVGTTTVASNGTWSLSGLTIKATGTHQFMAMQMDAMGNASPLSNSHTVNLNVNLTVNGDFSAGVSGFMTDFSAAQLYTAGTASFTSGSTFIWNQAAHAYDVDATFTAVGKTDALTNLAASGCATDVGGGNRVGTVGTLTWSSDYGTASGPVGQYDNPDAAMQGNVFMGNLHSAGGYGAVWKETLDIYAGRTYTLTFDYLQQGAYPVVIFGDVCAEFDKALYDFGHVTATFTATQTGTIYYGVGARGIGATYAAGAYGDIALDNIKLTVGAITNDGSLVSGAMAGSTSGADTVSYSSNILNTDAGNDLISVASTVQDTLSGGGRINGAAGVDTLKLASGTTLDLTALTNNQTVKQIQEVEIFQLQGSSKLTLNANDVLALGGANLAGYSFYSTSGGTASATSTDKVQMVITGTGTDLLVLNNLMLDGVTQGSLQGNTGLAGSWLFMGNTTISGTTYYVYNHSTTNAQVLTTLNATTQSDSVAFTSMTKDTATGGATGTMIGADTANANWVTMDTSAGRLVSGTLATPLVAGQSVKVYRDVNGTATLIGNAVVNAAGTSWVITDTSGYNGIWAYTASVVDSANNVIASATRAIISVDAAESAPLITSVTNSAGNITSGTGNETGTTASAITGISGTSTGADGTVVTIYDNRSTNLIGTATVSGGTWSLTGLSLKGTGSHVFMAREVDALGNASLLSNSHTVMETTSIVTNGDFSNGLTGFYTSLGFNGAGENSTSGVIWTSGYAFYNSTGVNVPLTSVGGGTVNGINWSTQYGVLADALAQPATGKFSNQYMQVSPGAGSVWKTLWGQNINVVAGETYQFTFDYRTFTPNAYVFIGTNQIYWNTYSSTSAMEFGSFKAIYTATTTGALAFGVQAYAAGSGYNDYAFDNISVGAPSADGTLAVGKNFIGASDGADTIAYASGVYNTFNGNDVITVAATTIQTTLGTAGNRINGGGGMDTLKLAASTTLDLSAAALTLNQTVKAIQEVEIITLQGNSTLTLSANDALSLGMTDAFASNGKVQFMVNGTSTDTVTLKNLLTDGVAANGIVGNTDLAGYWSKVGRQTFNSVSYDIYDHSATGAEVWIQATAKVAPMIGITRSGSGPMLGAETITFTLSQATTNFIQSDVVVTGGVLSNWVVGATNSAGQQTYTATFTPTASSTGTASIRVGNSAFSGTVTNLYNADANDADNTLTMSFDTIAPTIALTQSVTDSTHSQLTFTLNRASSDFDASDVTLNTGSLSNWTHVGLNASGKDIYIATYTYTAGVNKVVSVASGAFTDALGRANADGNDNNNQLIFSDVVSSQGGVIYGGNYTGYPPILLEPATVIGAGEMVTSLKMSMDYYATSGDGLSMAFGSGAYRLGLEEYGLVNGFGATIDTLSGTFGGSWAQIYTNDYTGTNNAIKTAYALVGNRHADFEIAATGRATLSIDGVVVVTRELGNDWLTDSQAGWHFQVGGRTGADGGYFEVSNINFSYNKVGSGSPLMLDLNGDGVQTVSVGQGVDFDLNALGTTQHIGWIDTNDALLALDLNGDGVINSGAELFGDHTQLANGSLAADGWLALAQYDVNFDGTLDQHDAVFANLKLWVDANANGQTDSAELKTLAEQGILSINLQADSQVVAQNGNILRGFSTFTAADGQTHQITDAWLAVQQQVQSDEQLRNGAPVLSA